MRRNIIFVAVETVVISSEVDILFSVFFKDESN